MSGSTLVILLLLLVIAALLVALTRQRAAHRVAAQHADRMARVLLTISRANRMVLRIEDDRALFQEACRICVEAGNAMLAVVYLREGELAHRVASAGPGLQMLRNVPDPLDLRLPEIQDTYTARVLREGRSVVSNNYVLDARAGRWREEAVQQGLRAIAWIPIRRGGAVVGVLMLCARQADFFDAPLVALLEELGADLSFALDNMDSRRPPGSPSPPAASDTDRPGHAAQDMTPWAPPSSHSSLD